jgi:hypothetical protein
VLTGSDRRLNRSREEAERERVDDEGDNLGGSGYRNDEDDDDEMEL